jgi:hypothetical protein
MKKNILTAVMAFTLFSVGLIDFSYAKGLAKGTLELRGEEMAQEKSPGFDEREIEQDADDSYEKDREDDVLDDVVDDDDDELDDVVDDDEEEDEGL